ncbi:MAG TPA: right-handed parallel beta-helix repeat-containing protein, partial [Gammaproteobacteria bacterium]|nr:right-handed parallel beta-helix repeat-containing protein [Gammaproteobacteria bacterium]
MISGWRAGGSALVRRAAFLITLCLSLFAQAQTVTIFDVSLAPYGVCSGCDATANRNGLQAAINAAAAGDVIYIPNGTYEFKQSPSAWSILISKSLTIRGQSREATIVAMTAEDAADDAIAGNAHALFYVNAANDVTFEYLDMDGNKAGKGASTEYVEAVEHHRGIFVDGTDDVTIRYTTIHDFTGDAVQLYNGVEDTHIHHFTARHNQRDGVTFSPSSALTPVQRVSLHDCLLTGSSNQQIDNEHGPAHDIEVYNCTIFAPEMVRSSGIAIAGAGTDITAPSLRWNIHNNDITGQVLFVWTSDSVIRDNIINNPRRLSAVSMERAVSNTLIENNVITQTSTAVANLAGVMMAGTAGSGATNVTVRGNQITTTFSQAFGVRIDGAVSATVENNVITGSGTVATGFHGVRVRSTVEARPV